MSDNVPPAVGISNTTNTTASNPTPSSVVYSNPPSNALAYLYPSLALAIGIAITLAVCRLVDRRRRVRRALRSGLGLALANEQARHQAQPKPEIYDVLLEKSRSDPYGDGVAGSMNRPPRDQPLYSWSDVRPLSANLTRTSQAPPRPAPQGEPRTRPSRIFPRALSSIRTPSVLGSRNHDQDSRYQEQSQSIPHAYDTLVTGVIIAMPSAVNRARKPSHAELTDTHGDMDKLLPEIVFGSVKRPWQAD